MLGVCCHYLKEAIKPKNGEKYFVNEMDERVLQLGRYRSGKYSQEFIRNTYVSNVRNLATMLPKIRKNGIRHFRISSALFPLADQVPRELWDNDDVRHRLKSVGDYVKTNDMRVTTHPGQFCVLSSDSDKVVDNAFRELATHGWMFDAMGLDHTSKWSINVHGGKSDRTSRLIDSIKSLPDNVRKRLTLENDESAYSVLQLLEVHQATGTPICFDSHHHVFNDDDMTMEEAFDASCATWTDGIKPLQHLSNTEPSSAGGSFADRRKHSNMIHYVPDPQLKALRDNAIDVEIEAKLKNVSVFKMARDFDITL